MVQIIEENRRPSFAEKLNTAVGSGLQGANQLYQQKTEDEAIKKFGMDLSGIRDPELRKIFAAQVLKSQVASTKGSQKKLEDAEKFSTGLEILSGMKEIANRGKIGRGSGFLGFFPGETARDRNEFAQLGKSLIPIVAAGVPIRNQREFEEYKKVITDPSASLSEIEGAIQGLEKIFKLKLGESLHEGSHEAETAVPSSKNGSLKKVKTGTPLTAEAMQKIYEKVGGDKAKAKALAKKMGYKVE